MGAHSRHGVVAWKRASVGDGTENGNLVVVQKVGQAGLDRLQPGDNRGMRVHMMAYDPENPVRVAVATAYGLYVCEDIGALIDEVEAGGAIAGDHWQRVHASITNPRMSFVSFLPGGRVVFPLDDTIYTYAQQNDLSWQLASTDDRWNTHSTA